MASLELLEAAGFHAKPNVTTLRDVSAAEFIKAYSAHLKKGGKLQLPEWVDVVKTAKTREMPPADPDWYFVRAASIARKLYIASPGLGVGQLAHWYGKAGAKQTKPQKHTRASRAIIRHILSQLEKIGVVEKNSKGGRKLTQEGQKDLDTIARTASAV